MDSQATNSDSMISTQMPVKEDPQKALYTPYSNNKEPLLQPEDRALQPDAPTDTTNLSGFEKLMSLEGVYIAKDGYREDVPCCICGCVGRDFFSYAITAAYNGKGRRPPAIFQGYEDFDDCPQTWCCSADLRRVDIDIKHRVEYDKSNPKKGSFLKLEKKVKCSILCMFRPELIVTLVEEGKNEKIGKIVNSVPIFEAFKVKIFDASDALRYVIKGNCCFCCLGKLDKKLVVCDPFGTVLTRVPIIEDDRYPTGGGCEFFMTFPKESTTGADRALLIAGLLMIGKSFFEDSDFMRAFKECCKECPKGDCPDFN